MRSDSREFFEQLGNLFYALAMDRSIEPIEFPELKMLISKEWMAHPQDSNLPIPENIHLMFVEMDNLQASQVPSADAFNGFAQYYTKHPEVFTPVLLDRIKKTANSINEFFPTHHPYKKDHFSDLLILLQKKMNITNS